MQTTSASTRIQQAKRLFYAAAFMSFLLSVSLYFLLGDERAGIFVGLWVPSILSFGNLVLNGEDLR
ncbi:MAG: hypothetical protein FJW95_15375 [Actinobacteria bacterium]|nr:hypothetical protein [Actinomycetota bacterium]